MTVKIKANKKKTLTSLEHYKHKQGDELALKIYKNANQGHSKVCLQGRINMSKFAVNMNLN